MRTIFIAGVIAGTIASAANAQSAKRVPNPERAAALISQAQQLNIVTEKKRIAVLYEKASGFFAPSDPQASQTLNYAAQFYYHAGDKKHAIELLERGAALASARGASVEAADLYVAAAIAATETQDYMKRRQFVDNVLRLATGVMPETDRVRLLRRVVPSANADR